MPHPERACEPVLGSADGLVLFESVVERARRRTGAARGRALQPHEPVDHRRPRTPRPEARRVRPHRARARPRAEPDRARHLLGDVVRALQLQELARPPEDAADDGPARAAGPGRERRRRRHRRRPGRGLQDRIAQPPVVHRAVPGRGDRRRRHHPRHLHDGRAADRAAELAALRPAGRPAGARTRRIVEGVVAGIAGYGNSIGIPTVGGEIAFDDCYAGNPLVNVFCLGIAQADALVKGTRRRRRQPGVLRRREDRPRRHPRRDDGVGGVRRGVGGEAPGGAGRRSVHGEAAARGLPRADEDRRARRHPGHGRRRADLLDVRDGRARRQRHRDRRARTCRSARPA